MLPPVAVLDGHLHHAGFDFIFSARSAGTTAGGAIVLPSNQLSVPARSVSGVTIVAICARARRPSPFALAREPPTLIVRETKSPSAELLAQNKERVLGRTAFFTYRF